MTNPDPDTLLPCPFCGNAALTSRNRDRHKNDGEWDAICCECSASVRMEYSEDAAISAWNRRSPAGGKGNGSSNAILSPTPKSADTEAKPSAAGEP
jgi:Lar family restriction alleviation protein